MKVVFQVLIVVGITLSVGVFAKRCPNYKEFLEQSRARPVAKLMSTNVCYWAFDQGPCEPGQWFRFSDDVRTLNTSRPGRCEKRVCPDNSVDDRTAAYPRFWFEHKGECFLTDVHNIKFCGNNTTKIYYTEDDDVPTCRETPPTVMKNRGLFGSVFKKIRGF